jgi:hypothetical protein
MDPNKWTAKTQAAVSAAQVRVLGGEGEGRLRGDVAHSVERG